MQEGALFFSESMEGSAATTGNNVNDAILIRSVVQVFMARHSERNAVFHE